MNALKLALTAAGAWLLTSATRRALRVGPTGLNVDQSAKGLFI